MAMIVIITGERMFVITFPKKVNKWINHKTARFIVVITFGFCALVNSHFLFSHNIINENFDSITNESEILNKSRRPYLFEVDNLKFKIRCLPIRWYTFYDNYWPYIDATIYSFLPFVLLTFLNILICKYLIESKKSRLKFDTSQKPGILRFSPVHVKNSIEIFNEAKINMKRKSSSVNNVSNKNKNDCETDEDFIHKKKYNSMSNVCYHYDGGMERLGVHKLAKTTICSSLKNLKNSDRIKHSKVSVRFDNINNIMSIEELDKMVQKYSKTEKLDIASSVAVKVKIKQDAQRFEGVGKRLIVLVLLINVSFFAFTMPIVILQIVDLFNVVGHQNLLKEVAELLQYLNHSVNFFLYILSGKQFRNEAKKLIMSFLNWISECARWMKNDAIGSFFLCFI